MPIYEFQCDGCGHVFERLQKLSDSDPDTCPQCDEHAIRRRLTAPAFRLAGSGWYETDFKKDGDNKRNLVDKGDGGSDSNSAKSDSKSESGSSDSGKSATVESKSDRKANSGSSDAASASRPDRAGNTSDSGAKAPPVAPAASKPAAPKPPSE